jgi:hypothetical protein
MEKSYIQGIRQILRNKGRGPWVLIPCNSVSTDLVLQVGVYRSMLCEQGDTRADDRHAAFVS